MLIPIVFFYYKKQTPVSTNITENFQVLSIQPSGWSAHPPRPQLQVLRPRVRVRRGAVAEGLPGGILRDESGRYRKSVGAIAERDDG